MHKSFPAKDLSDLNLHQLQLSCCCQLIAADDQSCLNGGNTHRIITSCCNAIAIFNQISRSSSHRVS